MSNVLTLNKTFNGHLLCRRVGTPFFMSGYYEPDGWYRAGKWSNPNIEYVEGVASAALIREVDSCGFGARVSTSWKGWGRWNSTHQMIKTGLTITDFKLTTTLTHHWNSIGDCMFALCSGHDPNYTMRSEWGGQSDTNMSTAHCTEVTGHVSGDYVTDWTIPVVSTNYTSDDVNSFMSFYQYSTTTNCMWETCTFTASGMLF